MYSHLYNLQPLVQPLVQPDARERLTLPHQGEVLRSNAILVDHICNDIAAFVGPEGPNCNVEAMVAASKNRAMISYRCSDPEVSDKSRYPTFTRMEPPDTQVPNGVIIIIIFIIIIFIIINTIIAILRSPRACWPC